MKEQLPEPSFGVFYTSFSLRIYQFACQGFEAGPAYCSAFEPYDKLARQTSVLGQSKATLEKNQQVVR